MDDAVCVYLGRTKSNGFAQDSWITSLAFLPYSSLIISNNLIVQHCQLLVIAQECLVAYETSCHDNDSSLSETK